MNIITLKLNDAIDDSANFSKHKNTRLFHVSSTTGFVYMTLVSVLTIDGLEKVEQDNVCKRLSTCLTQSCCSICIDWPMTFTFNLIQILKVELEDWFQGHWGN